MTYNFYKSDFGERAYARLIKLAREYGYKVDESNNFCEIDTTAVEDDMMRRCGLEMTSYAARCEWSQHMIRGLEDNARQKRYIAVPKNSVAGAVVFRHRRDAEYFCEKQEREAGENWTVIVSYEY